MNSPKKSGFTKPQLFIAVQEPLKNHEQAKDMSFKNQVSTKPLSSAKNTRQIRKFNFDQKQTEQSNSGRELKKLKKLEEEKANLMDSLRILKESAVSAIAQKEDCIEKLKLRDTHEDPNMQLYQQQFERGKQIRIDLEKETEELRHQMHQSRQQYITQLEEKEYLIERLYRQIQEVRRQLQSLEQSDYSKTKKIKLLQQQNSQLSEQLQSSSIALPFRERLGSITDLDETIKINMALSAASSPPSKSFISYSDSQHYFQSEADKTFMMQKFEEMEKSHKEQLLDLKGFYEKRISSLRDIYQRQLHLHTDESDKDNRSRRGSRGQRSSQSGIYSKNHLNLKEMYSIQQIVQKELETSRSNIRNLKNQIKMQNLSQCPSLEPRQEPNDDTQSQFTTKYFQIPARFSMKKHQSIQIPYEQLDDSKTIYKIPKKQEPNLETQISLQQDSLTKKSYIFAAGLLSGVTITSIAAYFIKKP